MKALQLFHPLSSPGEPRDAGRPLRSVPAQRMAAGVWGVEEARLQWLTLSPRQQQWACLMVQGVGCVELAGQAQVSVAEMRVQRAHILRRLRASTLLELRLLLADLASPPGNTDMDRRFPPQKRHPI